MQSQTITPDEYTDNLPEDRKIIIDKLRKVIKKNLPDGFSECFYSGMINYVVPHSMYPKGYHCNPKLPLMLLSLASQKNFVSIYHMGLYMDKNLMNWFTEEYKKYCKSKPDMGKSCIRFKKPDDIPYKLIGELASKISPDMWIKIFEKNLNRGS